MARIQSWEVSDSFWEKVAPLIPPPERDPIKVYRRKPGGGKKPMPPRKIFEGILYVLRTGCQWKALPKERFGSPSAIHTHFMRWMHAGFFVALWRAGLAEYDEMEGAAGTRRRRPQPDRSGKKTEASDICLSTVVGSRCRSSSPGQIGTM
jgi:transposase